MTDETTQPPVREPNTPRVWLKRFWKWMVKQVGARPDIALILFILLFSLAMLMVVFT